MHLSRTRYVNPMGLSCVSSMSIPAKLEKFPSRPNLTPSHPIVPFQRFNERNVESRTKIGSKTRMKARRKAFGAVLDEQDIQREDGLEDDNFIASIYKEMAAQSLLEALDKGLKDQKVMLDILDPEVRKQREQGALLNPIATKEVALSIPRRGPYITDSLARSDLLQSFNLLTAI
jgi:hypothetical protein